MAKKSEIDVFEKYPALNRFYFLWEKVLKGEKVKDGK